MLFIITCYDRPGAFETRMAVRSRHIAYLKTYLEKIMDAGPLLDHDGRACGTFILLDVPDRAAAEGFAAGDPYAQINLFESVIIRPFRSVIRDQVFVE
ncbi:YciI family protein [Entomobacter blattae]|uniref:YCII-related domain-containing protein n=1 Tax=Entomobacter blattae TaxID=2762277 RepID=A0A7H1NTG8_9PROT|nr:YciI family protein [Entomobacter blattae]QNT79078.1 hypothetical protein JGUZn3_18640 [Entomobacter blattae]